MFHMKYTFLVCLAYCEFLVVSKSRIKVPIVYLACSSALRLCRYCFLKFSQAAESYLIEGFAYRVFGVSKPHSQQGREQFQQSIEDFRGGLVFGRRKAYEVMLMMSLSVNAPLYSARPTITPSTPSLSSGSSRRISPNVATPPEAMTGIPTERATLAVSSTFTPVCVPSRPISV